MEIGIPDPEDFGPPFLPGWEIPVVAYLREPGHHAEYEYDFGDSWTHDLILEEVGPRRSAVKYPRCPAGARACPPEDCGGVHGYQALLAALSDPTDEEHDDVRRWVGPAFDPERFDPARVRFSSPKQRWRRVFGAT